MSERAVDDQTELGEARRGWRLVLAAATLHFSLWSLAGFLHIAPPYDVPEQLAWGAEWVLGTHKLPPLPSWLLEIAWQIGGMYGIAVLAAGAVSVAFPLVYALGLRLMPAREAAAGSLLLAGIYFFSWPVHEFNHNMLQIPLWAAFVLVFRICLEGRETGTRYAAWAALGLILALSLWTKYASMLLAATAGLWLLASRRDRGLLLTAGPWLAAIVAVIVFAPHLVWLAEHGWAPVQYFLERQSRGSHPLKFAATQVLHHLPAVLLLLCGGLLTRRVFGEGFRNLGDRDRFLIVMALGPFVMAVTTALVMGTKLRSMWGAPMFCLSGLLLIRLVRDAVDPARLRRLAKWALGLLCAVPAAYMVALFAVPEIRGTPYRVNWPMRAIGAEVLRTCEASIGRGPAVVAGDRSGEGRFLAGLAALAIQGGAPGARRPKVLLDAELGHSPWVDVAAMKRGTVFVWRVRDGGGRIPGEVRRLAERVSPGPTAPEIVLIPWPRMNPRPGLRVSILCVAGP